MLPVDRHERPTDPDDPLSQQNIKDRFFGINDPVAEKLLNRYNSMPKLDAPEDKAVTTIYVGNLGDSVTEADIRSGQVSNQRQRRGGSPLRWRDVKLPAKLQ